MFQFMKIFLKRAALFPLSIVLVDAQGARRYIMMIMNVFTSTHCLLLLQLLAFIPAVSAVEEPMIDSATETDVSYIVASLISETLALRSVSIEQDKLARVTINSRRKSAGDIEAALDVYLGSAALHVGDVSVMNEIIRDAPGYSIHVSIAETLNVKEWTATVLRAVASRQFNGYVYFYIHSNGTARVEPYRLVSIADYRRRISDK